MQNTWQARQALGSVDSIFENGTVAHTVISVPDGGGTDLLFGLPSHDKDRFSWGGRGVLLLLSGHQKEQVPTQQADTISLFTQLLSLSPAVSTSLLSSRCSDKEADTAWTW